MGLVVLTAKPDRVPPMRVMSDSIKPTGASLNVKVIVAVWPAIRLEAALVMARVGAAVSNVSVGVMPAPPVLPAASVYAPLETVMMAVPELEAVGVKVAV